MDSKSLPILCELWQEEGISQTELSHRCHMANYTVTRILDQLQEKSFITRHQELENRRVFQIFLTVTAKAMKQDVLYDIEKINNQYLSKLTQCNQQELINLLKLAQADCTDN